MPNHGYQIWVVPLNLAGVLMDPVEQWKVEVRGVVVSEFSAGSPLVYPMESLSQGLHFISEFISIFVASPIHEANDSFAQVKSYMKRDAYWCSTDEDWGQARIEKEKKLLVLFPISVVFPVCILLPTTPRSPVRIQNAIRERPDPTQPVPATPPSHHRPLYGAQRTLPPDGRESHQRLREWLQRTRHPHCQPPRRVGVDDNSTPWIGDNSSGVASLRLPSSHRNHSRHHGYNNNEARSAEVHVLHEFTSITTSRCGC
jgi:hypothetical protein